MANNVENNTSLMHEHQGGESRKNISDTGSLYQKQSNESTKKGDEGNRGNGKDFWEKPISLKDGDINELPEGVFPKWVDDFIYAVAEETQTPPDAAAFAALSALSAILNKKYEINVRGSWTEYLNLYITLALDSGNRKSAVFNLFNKPILKYQHDERVRVSRVISKEVATIKAKEKNLLSLEGEYAKNPTNDLMEEIKILATDIEGLKRKVTVLPKFIASDATPERLAIIMMEQNGRIALLSAEGAEVFEMIAGRYGEKPNQDLYLKAFNSEAFDVERVSRSPIHLEAPSMVIGLFVQSSVIENIPSEFTGRGLTQRFLYSFPTSFLGRRNVRPKEICDSLTEVYEANVRELLKYKNKKDGSLGLSEDAILLLEQQMEEIEIMLGNKNVNVGMIGWLSKLTGSIIRIAGILHVAENVQDLDAMPHVISKDTLEKAFSLKEYLISHAEKGFGIMGVDEKVEDLEYLIDIIKEKCEGDKSLKVTYREIFESTKRRFNTATVFKEKLQELEELYWIKQIKKGKQYIFLNPNTDR